MAMRIRTPRKRKPTGTPRPTGGVRGATQAQLNKIRQRQKPTGTPRPQKLKQGVVAPRDLPKPTSAQKAAMRKQKIAKYGNAAKRRRMVDTATKRAVRQGMATPGQIRSYKSTNQKIALGRSMPKRTTKRTSRRLV